MIKELKQSVLNENELSRHISGHEITFASSAPENKRLTGSFLGILKVYVDDMCKWSGFDLRSAVQAYNSIQEGKK